MSQQQFDTSQASGDVEYGNEMIQYSQYPDTANGFLLQDAFTDLEEQPRNHHFEVVQPTPTIQDENTPPFGHSMTPKQSSIRGSTNPLSSLPASLNRFHTMPSILNSTAGPIKAISRQSSFGRKLGEPLKSAGVPKAKPSTERGAGNGPVTARKIVKAGRRADMSSSQVAVYDKVKIKLLELLYKENPYMSTKELADRMSQHWNDELVSRKLSPVDCPYEPIPKKHFTKLYPRVKSRLLSEAAKNLPYYYNIQLEDGTLKPEAIQQLLYKDSYIVLDPQTPGHGQLRYYNHSIAKLCNDGVIGKNGISYEHIQEWVGAPMISFLFTIIHFALQKHLPGKKNVQIEEHTAVPIYQLHSTGFQQLYGHTSLFRLAIDAFLKNVDTYRQKPIMRSDPQKQAQAVADGMDIEARRAAQMAYFESFGNTAANSSCTKLSAEAPAAPFEQPNTDKGPSDLISFDKEGSASSEIESSASPLLQGAVEVSATDTASPPNVENLTATAPTLPVSDSGNAVPQPATSLEIPETFNQPTAETSRCGNEQQTAAADEVPPETSKQPKQKPRKTKEAVTKPLDAAATQPEVDSAIADASTATNVDTHPKRRRRNNVKKRP